MRATLSDRERKFVEEFIIDGNGTQAALRSGYSPASARTRSAQLLTKPAVIAAIANNREKVRERIGVTRDAIVDELRKIAFADIRNAVKWGSSPNISQTGDAIYPVELVPSNMIDDDTAGAVSEVSLTNTGVKIKMYDKKGALMDLAKIMGYVIEKSEVDQKMSVTFNGKDADL